MYGKCVANYLENHMDVRSMRIRVSLTASWFHSKYVAVNQTKHSNALQAVRRGSAACANTITAYQIIVNCTGFVAERRIMCNRQTHCERHTHKIQSVKVHECIACTEQRMNLNKIEMQLSQCTLVPQTGFQCEASACVWALFYGTHSLSRVRVFVSIASIMLSFQCFADKCHGFSDFRNVAQRGRVQFSFHVCIAHRIRAHWQNTNKQNEQKYAE